MRKKILLAPCILLISIVGWTQKPVIFQQDGKAISGYDVVSYYNQGYPVKGYDSLSVQWENAIWLFATTENKNAFKTSPEKYRPQFGGYCAYGMSRGYKAPTEPDAWTIENGLLYFNYNKKVKETWDKDRVGYIEKANKNWIDVKTK
jgi:hypothetical protein